ncbi:hypothetical protein ICV32_03000 [Polynucleobacter sp. MWH-UH24A]|uniref:hypothetical protein n=1 Tax=Polynucleobacter sp. MWH-UH24A TaxID=2689110 RepID=UPI001BFDE59A|nr:hypothetical protein [Polynucleobacter sp. MWH-UH24A]QWD76647.1 hypothetical protein ICV32_03000 [Polynucleobacter sp. MWH-UH24A]
MYDENQSLKRKNSNFTLSGNTKKNNHENKKQLDKDIKNYNKEKLKKSSIQELVEKITFNDEHITSQIIKFTQIENKSETIPYLYCLSLELISFEIVKTRRNFKFDLETINEIIKRYKHQKLLQIRLNTKTHLSISEISKVCDTILGDIQRMSEPLSEENLKNSSLNWLLIRLRFSDIEFNETEVTQIIIKTIENFINYIETFLLTNISPETHHEIHSK